MAPVLLQQLPHDTYIVGKMTNRDRPLHPATTWQEATLRDHEEIMSGRANQDWRLPHDWEELAESDDDYAE